MFRGIEYAKKYINQEPTKFLYVSTNSAEYYLVDEYIKLDRGFGIFFDTTHYTQWSVDEDITSRKGWRKNHVATHRMYQLHLFVLGKYISITIRGHRCEHEQTVGNTGHSW